MHHVIAKRDGHVFAASFLSLSFPSTHDLTVSSLTVMDYQRCAALHNEILFRGWTGNGQDWIQPQTWWENQGPSEETARRLSPSVIEFLKRAYLIPDSPTPFCFFFYLGSLAPASQMLSNGFLDESRYILLYGSSPWSLGDTLGLVYVFALMG
jgi:hypothetical protein